MDIASDCSVKSIVKTIDMVTTNVNSLIHLSDPTLCKADGKIGNIWGRKEEKQRKASNSVGDGQGWVFLRGTVHTIAFYSNLIHTT